MNTVQKKESGCARGVTRGHPRNGLACQRCHRFGTYAPTTRVCDRCLGTLPLVFVVRVRVAAELIRGDR
jgi:hypothetical protein